MDLRTGRAEMRARPTTPPRLELVRHPSVRPLLWLAGAGACHGSTTSLKFVLGFYAGPRGWCLKASPAGARTGAHTPVFVDRSLRPNGPGDSSPGLRPEADALGKGAPHRCGLKGRENPAR